MGSTVLTVRPNGTVRNRYTYEPFGDPVVQEGSDVHHRYTGGHRDPTGLCSLGRRHYDPSLARFVQPDPIVADVADPQTFNRYAYALGNPLRWLDPTGLFAEEGGTGGVNWDWFIVIGPYVIPAGPPPVPKVPNAVGNVPASPGGLGGGAPLSGFMPSPVPDLPPGVWTDPIQAAIAGKIGDLQTAVEVLTHPESSIWDRIAGVGVIADSVDDLYSLLSGPFGRTGKRAVAGEAIDKVKDRVRKSAEAAGGGRQSGSYTNTHESGKRSHGKGDRSRSQVSGHRVANERNDPHAATDWTPAKNDREAFKQEHLRLKNDGGPGNAENYNRIQSPGKRYTEQDGG